jgi:rhodanese-related sulfurtransferase
MKKIAYLLMLNVIFSAFGVDVGSLGCQCGSKKQNKQKYKNTENIVVAAAAPAPIVAVPAAQDPIASAALSRNVEDSLPQAQSAIVLDEFYPYDGRGPIQELSAEEVLALIDDPNVLIVNVLGTKYFLDFHIKNSISAPLKQLRALAKDWDKKKLIIPYCACSECDASLKAYWLLKDLDFKNVKAFEGGSREWWKKNYPYEGPAEQDYLREEGDNHHKKIMAMRDGPLRQVLLSAYWGLSA